MHGLGDYNGHYANLGKSFSEESYDFAGIDNRNFGDNKFHKRGYVSLFKLLTE